MNSYETEEEMRSVGSEQNEINEIDKKQTIYVIRPQFMPPNIKKILPLDCLTLNRSGKNSSQSKRMLSQLHLDNPFVKKDGTHSYEEESQILNKDFVEKKSEGSTKINEQQQELGCNNMNQKSSIWSFSDNISKYSAGDSDDIPNERCYLNLEIGNKAKSYKVQLNEASDTQKNSNIRDEKDQPAQKQPIYFRKKFTKSGSLNQFKLLGGCSEHLRNCRDFSPVSRKSILKNSLQYGRKDSIGSSLQSNKNNCKNSIIISENQNTVISKGKKVQFHKNKVIIKYNSNVFKKID